MDQNRRIGPRRNVAAFDLRLQRDLDRLGIGLRSSIPLGGVAGFDDLLAAIDAAHASTRRVESRPVTRRDAL